MVFYTSHLYVTSKDIKTYFFFKNIVYLHLRSSCNIKKFMFYLILVFTDSILSHKIPKFQNINNCNHFFYYELVFIVLYCNSNFVNKQLNQYAQLENCYHCIS